MPGLVLTTTPTVEGRPVRRHLGIVCGEVIVGINFVKDFFGRIRDVIGGRSRTYETELQRGRDAALKELEERALALGANAVIGIDFDYEVLGQGNGMMMIVVSGTAVELS